MHANPQQAARGEVIYGIGDFADEMAFLLRYSKAWRETSACRRRLQRRCARAPGNAPTTHTAVGHCASSCLPASRRHPDRDALLPSRGTVAMYAAEGTFELLAGCANTGDGFGDFELYRRCVPRPSLPPLRNPLSRPVSPPI